MKMATEFKSLEEAKTFVAFILEVDADSFKEVPDLHAGGMDLLLLDDLDISEKKKKLIRDRMNNQKGFRVVKNDQEIKIVIGRFQSGYDCWILGKNGFAQRI
ncbi:MAG: hypothetical protein U9Q72_03120 [Patescibacteria group bacterium]|nr:hypothetical protein [Patescibacteria group bacterium]